MSLEVSGGLMAGVVVIVVEHLSALREARFVLVRGCSHHGGGGVVPGVAFPLT